MKYFRFKTFTTAYYFPEFPPEMNYMYGLYSPYGGIIAKYYWLLFKKCLLIRKLTAVEDSRLPFPYQKILDCAGNVLLSFNMGSPGIEQKISMLGYDNDQHVPFFAKFSQKEVARKLTQNEIAVYNKLAMTEIAPRLQDSIIGEDYVYMRTEYVNGKRLDNSTLTDKVLRLCLSLRSIHLDEVFECNGLRYSLSHGDFCPWNILDNNGELKLVDWEMAKDRPLGYDLFMYICQVSALFNPDRALIEAVYRNIEPIEYYFKMCEEEDFRPYLRYFAREKATYEKIKNNIELYRKYIELGNSL